MQVPFAQVLGRFAQKKAPGEVDLLGGFAFIVSFWRIVCYNGSAVHPAHFMGREVDSMVHLLAILESVAANVMSHYICKWLDRFDKDRKPD